MAPGKCGKRAPEKGNALSKIEHLGRRLDRDSNETASLSPAAYRLGAIVALLDPALVAHAIFAFAEARL